MPVTATPAPPPADAGDVTDAGTALLAREMARLSRKRSLTLKEIDLVVRIVRASTEIQAIQLNPLTPAQKKALTKLPDAELRAAIEALEAKEAAPPAATDRGQGQ